MVSVYLSDEQKHKNSPIFWAPELKAIKNLEPWTNISAEGRTNTEGNTFVEVEREEKEIKLVSRITIGEK